MIKVLLICGLLAVGAYALRGRPTATHLALRRLTAVAVLILGVVAVMFPNSTTWVANRVGVGRGTDLVFYVFAVVSLFVWVGMYRRYVDLEARFVQLTRRIALESAQHPPEPLPREAGHMGTTTAEREPSGVARA